jgi:DNA polymerase I-like protein with 3'-5' exonuclease and polymerase domains
MRSLLFVIPTEYLNRYNVERLLAAAAEDAGIGSDYRIVGPEKFYPDTVHVVFGATLFKRLFPGQEWRNHWSDPIPVASNSYVLPTLHLWEVIKNWDYYLSLVYDLRKAQRLRSISAKQLLGLGTYRVCRTLRDVEWAVDHLLSSRMFAFDVETEGFSTHEDDEILSIQFSSAPGEGIVVPLRGSYLRHEQDVYSDAQLEEGEWGFSKRRDGTVVRRLYKQVDGRRKPIKPAFPAGSIVCREPDRHDARDHVCRGVLTDVWGGEPTVYTGPGRMHGKTVPAELIKVIDLIRKLLESDVEKAGYNVKFDMHALSYQWGIVPRRVVWDGMLLLHLLQEERPPEGYKLETARRRFTFMPRYETELKSSFRHSFAEIPQEMLWQYGAADADCEFRIIQPMIEELKVESPQLIETYRTIIAPYLRTLFQMEENGLLVDRDRVRVLQERYRSYLSSLEQEMDELCRSRRIDPVPWTNTGLLRQLLFQKEYEHNGQKRRGFGLPTKHVGRTDRGLPRVDAKALLTLYEWAKERPSRKPVERLLWLLRQHRAVQKVLSTYLGDTGTGMLRFIRDDGRIHSEFLPVTKTGRLSSSKPNTENLKHDEEPMLDDGSPNPLYGYGVRTVFTAPPGHVLMEIDYSAQELRILAELSGEKTLLDAFYCCTCGESFYPTDEEPWKPFKLREHAHEMKHPLRDPHRQTASVVFRVRYDEVTDHQRTLAKRANFGLNYGQSVFGFARTFSLPEDEARRIVNDYFSALPSVRSWQSQLRALVSKAEPVSTVFHRLRRTRPVYRQRLLLGDDRAFRGMQRQIINFPIQSAGADILAMVSSALVDCEGAEREERLHKLAKRILGYYPSLELRALGVRIVNLVHDSLVFECPEGAVAEAASIIKHTAERLPYFVLRWFLPVDISWGPSLGLSLSGDEDAASGRPA